MNRKDFQASPEVNRPQRLVTGWISTIDVDMDGDVVLPGGMNADAYFETTRSVNLCHNPDAAIGVCRNISSKSRGVYATTFIGRHQLGEDTMTMIEDGILRNFSIEWDPRTLIAGPPTDQEKRMYGDGCKQVFRKWELTRYAMTPRPCNPKCVVESVKDDTNVRAMQDIWDRMQALFDGGKISRSSAVLAGFPDTPTRKFWDTGAKKSRKAVYVDGAIVVR